MRTNRSRACRLAALVILPCLQAQMSVAAETPDAVAAVEGYVLARSGVVVPGATVRITGATGANVDLITDAEGAFRYDGLTAGLTYTLEVVAQGRGADGTRTLTPRPGQVLHFDLVLVAQTTDSTGTPIDSERAVTRTRYDAGFIDGLPIIGHNYQDVLALAPGVDDPDGDGRPNVRGSRDTGLLYRFDRGDTTDPATGTFGMNLNPLAIDSVEVVTAGAPAEYGRAMGGFSTIATRSGGNDLEGRLVLYWRGRFLDGDGADNDDVVTFDGDDDVMWHDFRAAAAVGGPILRDRLWYFVTLESLNTEEPTGQVGTGETVTSRGVYGFGKLTWQVDGIHKLSLQVAADPRRFEGLGLYPLSSSDSGFSLDQRALDAQLHWSAAMPGGVLLEAAVTSFESDVSEDPASSAFKPTEVFLIASPGSLGGVAALYPCETFNCDETAGERSIYQFDFFSGRVTGPYFRMSDDDRDRHALRADVSWGYEGPGGSHRLKAGMEIADETLNSDLVTNPILYDLTAPAFGPPGSNRITGFQLLQTVQPMERQREVQGFNSGLYVSDSWKPWSNLVLTFGLRFDNEDIDAPGLTPFDPVRDRKHSMTLWRAYCQEAVRQGLVSPFSNCNPLNTYDGQPPSGVSGFLSSYLDQDMDGVNDVPPAVAELDLNSDGIIAPFGVERNELFKHFTTQAEREAGNFEITDGNWSPRVGVSWDPANDGLTRVYAHWGRYYDRIPLGLGLADSYGATMTFGFTPDPVTQVITPGSLSTSSSRPSIVQLSHDLRTPRTDELSLGFERQLGPAWSVGVGYIRRKAENLPQDIELNHYTCKQSGEVIGIDPQAVCGRMGVLQTDKFGAVGSSFPGGGTRPNGIEDLYVANPYFNQVLRVENVDASDYQAYELRMVRSLHREWQMQASYTWSQARGSAEGTFSAVGDDPSTPPDENDYLDYDQRHRFKLQWVGHLPLGIILGTSIAWASGTPYSVALTTVADLDSSGNAVARYLLPTGRRNDQRNESIFQMDARIEKVFSFGRVHVSGFLLAENLLNTDDLTIYNVEPDGSGLVATREPGRRFEMGATLGF